MRQTKGLSSLSLVVVAFASAAIAAPASKAPAPAPKAAAPAPAPAPAPVAPAPVAPAYVAPAPTPAPAPTAVTTKPMNTEMLAERVTSDSEMMSTAEYSTRGGSALGKGSAIRAQISAGTANSVNVAQLQLEGGFLMSIQRNVDFGVNLRIPLSVGGLAPGATVRWNFANDGKLHMSVIGNLNLPIAINGNPTIGLGIEPGIVASYEITDKAEFFSALMVSYNQVIWQRAPVAGVRAAGFTGTLRSGLSYALMAKAGLFVNFDLMAGYEGNRRNVSIGDRTTGLAFGASLTAGFQMAL